MVTSKEPINPSANQGGPAAAGGFLFQAQLGVLFELQMLTQATVDRALDLAKAIPAWIRFEAESPVDDILIATSEGGFIAVQAKTSLNLTSAPNTPFAKVVQQFVRHWLVCRDGKGEDLWDRPLDPTRDRLVLAVGPSAPTSVRLDLPKALKSLSHLAPPSLNQREQNALEAFKACVQDAWVASTKDDWDPAVIQSIASLVSVMIFEPNGVYGSVMEELAARASSRENAEELISTLTATSIQWMRERGGADLPLLRQTLLRKRVSLAEPPSFQNDIRKLKDHSLQISFELQRYEAIDRETDMAIRVPRECQDAVLAAAQEGSFVVIGEPGAGKSAVINILARELRSLGDVVELAVDRYSAQDLAGLKFELGLENDLIKVLEAWDGPTDAWLIIDALDATRGGQGEIVFRSLIQRVLATKGRWKVVASIRTFDLRMGVQFRELFAGRPANPNFSDEAFSTVRHLLVRPWSNDEFEQVLSQAPELQSAMAGAPEKLRNLALVPFNTRLIYELLRAGAGNEAFRGLANQASLLRLYWDQRVTPIGTRADACLLHIIEKMIGDRALRAPVGLVAAATGDALDELLLKGVLSKVEHERFVQFRHHILFDYAASRLKLDVEGLVSGRVQYLKDQSIGLMLAPAMAFLLQELWAWEPDHSSYWSAVEKMLGNREGDPILRSVASRLSAELPEIATDALFIVGQLSPENKAAKMALWHVVSALGVSLEDSPNKNLIPWVSLAGGLASVAKEIPSTLGMLLHILIDKVNPTQTGPEVGSASRALFLYVFDNASPVIDSPQVIANVVATYATAPSDSRGLLKRIFEPWRMEKHNWKDVPALCREISKLANADPAFAAYVYSKTFQGGVTQNVVTTLGTPSRILSLKSNSVHDYVMAIYPLNKYFKTFLNSYPEAASRAFAESVGYYIQRAHPIPERGIISRTIGGHTYRLEKDLSFIWGHNPDDTYGQDGDGLIAEFLVTLVSMAEADAHLVAKTLATCSAWAVIWSRLFLAAIRRNDTLLDLLWPIATDEAWLTHLDTKKDAIDLVAQAYGRRSTEERIAFETSLTAFRMGDADDSGEERMRLCQTLYTAIGQNKLATAEARAIYTSMQKQAATYRVNNERPFRITRGAGSSERFFWITELDRERPTNVAVMDSIDAADRYIEGKSGRAPSEEIDTAHLLTLLETLAHQLIAPDVDKKLRLQGEGCIGKGCDVLAQGERLVAREGLDPTDRYLALLYLAANSENPEVLDDTESEFEKSQSWGGPAARIEAATAMLDLCRQRPDLYAQLEMPIDRLLVDPHPATRSQSLGNLLRLWDIDRDGIWRRLQQRAKQEPNFAVVSMILHLIGRVIHAAPNETERLVLALLDRYSCDAELGKLENGAAGLIAILWVDHQKESMEEILSSWLKTPAAHSEQLGRILVTLREALVDGLQPGQAASDDVRHRAQHLLHRIVVSATGPLAAYDSNAPLSEDQAQSLKNCVEIVDKAAMQLFFAISRDDGSSSLEELAYSVYLKEVTSTLEHIADHASSQALYYVLQFLEILAPRNPGQAFDLAARAIRIGGTKTGFQFELLGADLMVNLVSGFLADSKEIFASNDRRAALVDCLEIFMEAGWPAARRLLYRLPELLQ